jgi:hypothetical protein
MKRYDNIQWVVQKNLTGESAFSDLKRSCKNIEVDFVEIEVIPFTHDLPAFPTEKRSIFYGSTTFTNLIFVHPELNAGLFFNANYSIENYFEKYGENMLNYGAKITTFKEVMTLGCEPDKVFFIRPNDDTKSFAGEVKTFKNIEEWYESLKIIENTNLTLDTKIVVGEPFNIKSEWRLWIVNKKVVASSKYREYFKLKKQEGCPNEVIEFAEKRCAEYTPHDVFVMDIGLCGDEYYIIECGCLNAAGFYEANIQQIVTSVTEYFFNLS